MKEFCFKGNKGKNKWCVYMETVKKRFFNEHETAKITSISVKTLRNQRCLGEGIPYIKLRRSVRYDYEVVVRYMKEREVKIYDISSASK